MELKVRTTRTLKVTELAVTPEERTALANLYGNPDYQALLDVMERGCIELETAHFNTDIGHPEAVLGGHCLTKGVWQFFAYVQKQVLNAYNSRMADDDQSEPPSLNDVIQGVE
jgi:hypothetical protein